MENEQIQRILVEITAIAGQKACPVIGIDGLGGAGKSMISEALCKACEQHGFHTILLHIDDFIHVRNIRYNPDVPEWECYYRLQWRYDAFSALLLQIRSNSNAIEAELYDKEHDCYFRQPITVQPNSIVITEGIFLQREELQGIFDYMIYLDVPESERLKRVLKRDLYIGNAEEIQKKYENRYFPAEKYYFSTYAPNKSANMTIGYENA